MAAGLWLAALLEVTGQFPAAEAPARRVRAKCTVILQTRPNRLYCNATNAHFCVILREPARFAHGEVFTAEGVDRAFCVNLTEFCDAANRLPPRTEMEFVGLNFVETFADSPA